MAFLSLFLCCEGMFTQTGSPTGVPTAVGGQHRRRYSWAYQLAPQPRCGDKHRWSSMFLCVINEMTHS
jgi:hypothetical protein